MNDSVALPLTSSHWGVFRAETSGGKVTALHPFEADPDPSPIGQGILSTLDAPSRIKAPMVRKSWLEGGPGNDVLSGGKGRPDVCIGGLDADIASRGCEVVVSAI